MRSSPFFSPASLPVRYISTSTLLFALMSVSVKSVSHLPAVELVFFRSAIVLVLSAVVLFRRGIPFWGGDQWRWLLLRGVFGTLGLTTFFISIQHMPLASAVTLQYLSPLFTVIFSHLFLKERMRGFQVGAFLVAFAGVGLIKGFDTRISFLMMGVSVFSAACSAAAYTVIRKLKDAVDPYVLIFYFSLIATVAVTLPTSSAWETPLGLEWGALMAIGLLGYAAQYFMTKAFQVGVAAEVAIFIYVGSIYALGFGWLLWGETIPILSLAGLLLIIGAVSANSLFSRRLKAPSIR